MEPLLKESEAGIEETVRQCVRALLDALYFRMNTSGTEEGFNGVLGEIRIMKDPKGEVGKRVAEKGFNKSYVMFFACTDSEVNSNELELQLMELAISPDALSAMIRSMEPDYEKPDYAEGLEEAMELVAEVLSRAVIIPTGSPIYNALRRCINRAC